MNAQLRAAWCQVLGLEESQISDDSNFFTEGGDSVMAMQLVTAARERNVALDTETIFNHPNFMDMAKLCRPTEPENGSKVAFKPDFDKSVVQNCAGECGVEGDLIEDLFPATDFQLLSFHQHMIFGTMMLQMVYELRGALDPDLLRQTWQLLHDKNQILRTRLVKHDDRILQVVVNDKIHWASGHDVAKYKASDMSKRVGSGDPLFRYAIVSEGNRSFFIWTGHHGGLDGWTRRLIMDKLQEGLSNLTALKSERHGPNFKTFVEWRNSQSDKKSKAVAFWKQYLVGYKNLEGLQRPSSNYVSLGSSHFSRMIGIERLVDANSTVTLSTIGHAAWAVAIGSLWNVDDVLFATVKMGRQMGRDNSLPRVESIMGPMMTMNPVRVGLHNDMRIGDFLLQLQDQFVSTIPYEHEGWSTFRECFGLQVILPGMIDWHPLGSDLFSQSLEYKAPNGKVGYLKPREDLSANLTINSSMLVDIYEHEHQLKLRVSYDGNIWEEKRVMKLVDVFTDVLTRMLCSGDGKVGELLTDGAERMTRLKAHL